MKWLNTFFLIFIMSVAWAQLESQSSINDLLKKAEGGDVNAQLQLAEAYELGTGVAQDPEAAAQWCRKAAEQGNAKAQNTLGVMYRQGMGVPRDKAEAFHWYKEAAKKGLAEADYNVAISYFNGDGVVTDLNRAYAWMWLAQRHGNSSAAPVLKTIEEQVNHKLGMSKFYVAELLVKGNEVPVDVKLAGSILDEVRNDESSPSIDALEYEICQDYMAGKNVPQDSGTARSWCRKAGEDGEVEAYMVLGKMAEDGIGGPRDLKEAEIWYWDAALESREEGMMAMGRLKAQSSSHDDQKEAYFWYYLAQQHEAKEADGKLHEAATHLSSEEIAKEQQKASDWMQETLDRAKRNEKIKYP